MSNSNKRQFHSESVYDEKYLKSKMKSYKDNVQHLEILKWPYKDLVENYLKVQI